MAIHLCPKEAYSLKSVILTEAKLRFEKYSLKCRWLIHLQLEGQVGSDGLVVTDLRAVAGVHPRAGIPTLGSEGSVLAKKADS